MNEKLENWIYVVDKLNNIFGKEYTIFSLNITADYYTILWHSYEICDSSDVYKVETKEVIEHKAIKNLKLVRDELDFILNKL